MMHGVMFDHSKRYFYYEDDYYDLILSILFQKFNFFYRAELQSTIKRTVSFLNIEI
jgi:hypothetical protein